MKKAKNGLLKKIICFLVINIIIITFINIIFSVYIRSVSNGFTYKYQLRWVVQYIIIPLYLIITVKKFFSKNNAKLFLYYSLFIFYIIFVSNFIVYFIDTNVIDKIFHVMPDLDNLIMLIINTTSEFFVLIILILFNLLFIKIINNK